MKRYGNLWPDIISFENLLLSARKAQRGKRFRDNVLEFNHQLEANLLQLQHELITHTYQPGKYRTFEILDPKPRMISAAPYRDRVVHHALCNVIVAPIECTFIHDSYANRTGFGTHRALRKFTQLCRTHRYVKETLKAKHYLRYVDDFVLFSDDRGFLAESRCEIEAYLATLRLEIHPIKSQLFETRYGANFVGFRVLPKRLRIRSDNLRRGRSRLKQMQSHQAQGRMAAVAVSRSLSSWKAHLNHADTWRLQQAIFATIPMG